MQEIDVMMFNEDRNPSQGQSHPLFFTGSNGKDYLLKSQSVKIDGSIIIENCVFIQEMLAYQLAEYLNIPVPGYAIVNVDKAILSYNRKTQFNNLLLEGRYFATEVIPGNQQNILQNNTISSRINRPKYKEPLPDFYGKISNKEIFANLIAFDLFLLNFDRFGNNGNFIVSLDSFSNTYRGFAIDFGHSFFGPTWNLDKQKFLGLPTKIIDYATLKNYIDRVLDTLSQSNGYSGIVFPGLGEVFNAMERHIKFNHSNPFLEIVSKIKSFTRQKLQSYLDNIPLEWFVDEKAQKNLYLNFLMKQKELLPYIINTLYNYGAFSNNLGGNLEWKIDSQLGIQ